MCTSTLPLPALLVLMKTRSGRLPDFAGIRSQVPSVSRANVVPASKMRVLKLEDAEAMWTSTVFVPVLCVLMYARSGTPSPSALEI
jgi:hypothetical protein